MKGSMMQVGFLILGIIATPQVKWQPSEQWLRESKLVNRPAKGYVPTERIAVLIGLAAIEGRFGKEWIDDGKPFKAKLFGDTWVVYGSFEALDSKGRKNLGGPTTVEISKSTGTILGVYLRQ